MSKYLDTSGFLGRPPKTRSPNSSIPTTPDSIDGHNLNGLTRSNNVCHLDTFIHVLIICSCLCWRKKLNMCYFMKTTNILHDQYTVLKIIFTIKTHKLAYSRFTVHKIMIKIHIYSGNCSQ